MSVASTLVVLESKRCEGVAAAAHYGFGDIVPDFPKPPAIIWRFHAVENEGFAAENYDVRSGVLLFGASMTLLLGRYQGVGESELVGMLPEWVDRSLAMLGSDLLLGGSLASPLFGYLDTLGRVVWQRKYYLGLSLAYSLPVRIVAL